MQRGSLLWILILAMSLLTHIVLLWVPQVVELGVGPRDTGTEEQEVRPGQAGRFIVHTVLQLHALQPRVLQLPWRGKGSAVHLPAPLHHRPRCAPPAAVPAQRRRVAPLGACRHLRALAGAQAGGLGGGAFRGAAAAAVRTGAAEVRGRPCSCAVRHSMGWGLPARLPGTNAVLRHDCPLCCAWTFNPCSQSRPTAPPVPAGSGWSLSARDRRRRSGGRSGGARGGAAAATTTTTTGAGTGHASWSRSAGLASAGRGEGVGLEQFLPWQLAGVPTYPLSSSHLPPLPLRPSRRRQQEAAFAGGVRGGGRADYLGYYELLGLGAAQERGHVTQVGGRVVGARGGCKWLAGGERRLRTCIAADLCM